MKNKKKLLVLSVFVVLAIIFSVVYVIAVGNHYTLPLPAFEQAQHKEPTL